LSREKLKKNKKTFFPKTLDTPPRVCYNKGTKGKELKAMFKKVWIITRPAEVQAFKVKADNVDNFIKDKKVYKIEDFKGW
jgi:hypothetical protein